jgi:hypothetical protein
MEPTTNPADPEPSADAGRRDDTARHPVAANGAIGAWFERLDPGTHRRIKGLRLVTAYGLAAALGALQDVTHGLPRNVSVGLIAAGFALWASVSEARTTRPESSRDLALLCVAAAFGAAVYVCLAPVLLGLGHAGPELTLVTGAFLVGYLKRFGVLGAGLGSQIYIGQLMAYGSGLVFAELPAIAIEGLIAMLASIVPRLLSGPAERPAVVAALSAGPPPGPGHPSPEFVMGLQAESGALDVVALNA